MPSSKEVASPPLSFLLLPSHVEVSRLGSFSNPCHSDEPKLPYFVVIVLKHI